MFKMPPITTSQFTKKANKRSFPHFTRHGFGIMKKVFDDCIQCSFSNVEWDFLFQGVATNQKIAVVVNI